MRFGADQMTMLDRSALPIAASLAMAATTLTTATKTTGKKTGG